MENNPAWSAVPWKDVFNERRVISVRDSRAETGLIPANRVLSKVLSYMTECHRGWDVSGEALTPTGTLLYLFFPHTPRLNPSSWVGEFGVALHLNGWGRYA